MYCVDVWQNRIKSWSIWERMDWHKPSITPFRFVYDLKFVSYFWSFLCNCSNTCWMTLCVEFGLNWIKEKKSFEAHFRDSDSGLPGSRNKVARLYLSLSSHCSALLFFDLLFSCCRYFSPFIQGQWCWLSGNTVSGEQLSMSIRLGICQWRKIILSIY